MTTDTPRAACDVCVVGSANLDLVARAARLPGPGETVLGSDFAEHPGGKGLNQAVAAARSGATTAFVGAVGTDHAGDRLCAVAAGEGIDVAALATSPTPTGRALIGVDDHAENSIIVVPGANGTVTADQVTATMPSALVVLVQLEIPVEAVGAALATARSTGARTVLNPAPAARLPADLLALCDVVVPNEHELALVGGVDALLDAGVGAVVVTLGARGVRVVTAHSVTDVRAFPVVPVDTTGAGDSFCGALSARLAAGDDLLDAVRYASAAGALATTVAGAVPSLPRADAVWELLNAAG
jgi:ribokinase